jgi:hypothetical protein
MVSYYHWLLADLIIRGQHWRIPMAFVLNAPLTEDTFRANPYARYMTDGRASRMQHPISVSNIWPIHEI